MRQRAFIAAVLVLSSALSFGGVVNAIRAIVHDSVITAGEVEAATVPAVKQLMRQYANDPATFNQKYTAALADNLQQFLERRLIIHEFETSGYNIPESLIEENIQSRIREGWEDRRTLIKELQKQGRTYESWHRQMRDFIIVEAMRGRHARSDRLISPRRIEAYYQANLDKYVVEEQVRLSMIVLQRQGGTNDPAPRLARDLLEQIKGGASFGDLAATYSDGSQRNQRGDWGWVERSVLREELAKVAFALKPGEVSEVIETDEACYLMRVEEFKPSHHTPLRELQAEIERTLQAEAFTKQQEQWIGRLKRKTYVRLF